MIKAGQKAVNYRLQNQKDELRNMKDGMQSTKPLFHFFNSFQTTNLYLIQFFLAIVGVHSLDVSIWQ